MTTMPERLRMGAKSSFTKRITQSDVDDFARISGDDQAVHIDPAHAAQTRFGRRIVHGTILIGMVSAVLGHVIPDPGHTVIFLGQTCRFKSPAHPGDTVTVECEVTSVRSDKPVVTLACAAFNQDGTELMSGEATVYVDPHPLAPSQA